MKENCINLQNFNLLKSINDNVRFVILTVAMFMIVFNSMLPLRVLEETSLDTIVGFVLCGVCYLCIFDGKIYLDKFKHPITILVFLFGLITTVIGFKHGVLGYISYGVFFAFVVPAFITTVNSKKHMKILLFGMSIASIISFIIVFCCSILFTSLDIEQYAGITGNPNSIGAYAALAFLCCTYLTKETKNINRYLLYIIEGIAIGIVIFSRSRTALLMVFITVMFELFSIIINKQYKTNLKTLFIKIIAILASIYFAYFCVVYVSMFSQNIGFADNKAFLEKHFSNISQEEKIEQPEQSTQNKEPIEFEELIDASTKRNLKGFIDGGSISSGRTAIWFNFLCESNILGHEKSTLAIEADGYVKDYNAHNGYIQVTYNFGLIAGLIYLAISIYIGIMLFIIFVKGIKKKCQDSNITTVFKIFGNYFIYGMLASVVAPFSYFIVIMFSVGVLSYMVSIYKM